MSACASGARMIRGSRTAADSARVEASTNPAIASVAASVRGLALLVADEDGVAGRRERGREPAQVGDGAAAEDRLLDDPRRQPPGAHRRARRPVALGQEVGDGGQHLEAAHLDRAMAVPHGDRLGQPPERVGQPHVAQQVGPAAGRERRHGVVAEQRLLDAPGDVRQLQRRPPGH